MNATALQPTQPPSTLTVYTPAKINLTLRVLGQRDDGFHNLQSLVMGVDLCDRLDCTRTSQGQLTIHCSDPALTSQDNLVIRAARKLAQLHRVTPSMKIELTKRIPIGAGLGGGSSDAAATLQVCNDLWNLQLSKDELASIGSAIGSDVPLFFSLPSALISGRGEVVNPAPLQWKGWILLVLSGETVSTPAVYDAWKKEDCADISPDVTEQIQNATKASGITPLLFNDLEQAVFKLHPKVAEVFTKLNRLSTGTFRLTGAGSVFFQLFDHQEAAQDAVMKINEELPGVTCNVVAAPTVNTQANNEDNTWKSQTST